MTRTEALLAEFTHETTTARTHLARLPDAHFGWRPHAKSFTAGQLASHMIDCLRFVDTIFGADALDMDPADYTPFQGTSIADVLQAFDAEVAKATLVMSRSPDADASHPWQLKVLGQVWFEKPREAAYRDMALNHLIHHRGQFSVYLRLLDIAVPETYGPTADEGN